MRAAVFPGQGSQAVGMGHALAQASPAARAVFEEVDEALGESLSTLMFEGPAETLTLTENAQPALMAASLAAVRTLEAAGAPTASFAACAAGHSLGEYSALAAVGALGVGDAARLLRARGRAMQQAVPVGRGAMAALIGLDIDGAKAVAAAALDGGAPGEICEVANDNAPGQVVISGHKTAIDRALGLAKDKGAKRALPLNVSAPFHCALMAPAVEAMRAAFETVTFKAPSAPVIANVTAAPTGDPNEIQELLLRQITATVRWRESVARMVGDGVTELVEIGAGKVLSGLAKRIDAGLGARALNSSDDIDAFLSEIAA